MTWFTAATGGTTLGSGNPFIVTGVTATTTYYGACVVATCPSARAPLTVTVNPAPVVGNQTAAICSGTAFTVTPTSTPAGATYTWTAPAIAPAGSITGGSAQATAQTSISQTLTNTTGNPATATYTVTPTLGTCPGATFTVTVTVNPSTTPTFAAVGPYCSGAVIPALPTTSNEGITGTWAPAINNTATTTYTFTPTAGQCATTATLTITVNPNVTANICCCGSYIVQEQ